MGCFSSSVLFEGITKEQLANVSYWTESTCIRLKGLSGLLNLTIFLQHSWSVGRNRFQTHLSLWGQALSSFKGAQAFFLTSGYKEKEDWDAALERSVIGSTVACPNEHDATLSVVFYLPGASWPSVSPAPSGWSACRPPSSGTSPGHACSAPCPSPPRPGSAAHREEGERNRISIIAA